MSWYWIVLIVVVYIFVQGIVMGMIDRRNGDPGEVFIGGLLWPISLIMCAGYVLASKKEKEMTLEEYLDMPFKYDGKCNPVPISDIWSSLSRHQRREIQMLLKKGVVPDITKYL